MTFVQDFNRIMEEKEITNNDINQFDYVEYILLQVIKQILPLFLNKIRHDYIKEIIKCTSISNLSEFNVIYDSINSCTYYHTKSDINIHIWVVIFIINDVSKSIMEKNTNAKFSTFIYIICSYCIIHKIPNKLLSNIGSDAFVICDTDSYVDTRSESLKLAMKEYEEDQHFLM